MHVPKSGYSAKCCRHSDIDGYRMFDVSEVFGTCDATWCNNNNQENQPDDHSKDDIQMFIIIDLAVCFFCFCKT